MGIYWACFHPRRIRQKNGGGRFIRQRHSNPDEQNKGTDMTVRYEGKSPSALWYTWQKTKGIFATKQYKPFAKNTAGAGASATGTVLIQQQLATVLAYLPVGLVGLGGMAAYNAYKAVRPGNDAKNKISTGSRWTSAAKYAGAAVLLGVLTPTAATWVSLGLIGATGYFGLRSYQSWKAAADSHDVRNYVRKRESEWLEKKEAGPWRKRLAQKIKNIGASIRLGLAKTVKWGSMAAGTAATVATGLGVAQYYGAGILSAGAVSSITGTVASLGAAVGMAAAPALVTAAVIVAAVIPVSAVAGLIAHNKIREIRASRTENTTGNRFLKKARRIGEEADAPAATFSNDNAPKAAAAFNSTADSKPAEAPKAETPAPAATQNNEDLSDARRAAAEARRQRRKNKDGHKFG